MQNGPNRQWRLFGTERSGTIYTCRLLNQLSAAAGGKQVYRRQAGVLLTHIVCGSAIDLSVSFSLVFQHCNVGKQRQLRQNLSAGVFFGQKNGDFVRWVSVKQ